MCPSVEEVKAVNAPVADEESETITPFTEYEDEPVPPLATPSVPDVICEAPIAIASLVAAVKRP